MKKLLLFSFLLFPCLSDAGDVVKGLNLSSPLLFSGTFGYRMGTVEDPSLRPMIEIEAGVGGGKILLGFDGMGDGFGVGVKAAYLTTWFEPINLDADQ